MIDEETLINALHDVADSFEVSKDGADRILSEAGDSAPESRSSRVVALVRSPSRGRTILAVAAAVLVVGGISLPLMRNGGGPPVTAVAEKVVHGPLVVNGTGQTGATFGNVGTNDYSPTSSNSGMVATSAKTIAGAGAGAGLAPRIESSGSVDLRVKGGRIEPAFATLSRLASSDGGTVISTQAMVGTRTSGHFAYGIVVLQVPQHAFTALVNQVQRVGHPTSINISSTDVTAQYVDLRARIAAQEASRRQYLTIMTRAGSINDVLAVQRQLDSIQSQIEQLQGQLNVLNNQTTYGSLTVNLTTSNRQPIVAHRSGLSKAWHDAISGFVAGVEWLIRISGPVLFVVLCLGVLFGLGRFAWRATRRWRI